MYTRSIRPRPRLHVPPQARDTFGVLHNLASAELRLAVDPVYKRDGHLADGVPQRASADDDLHLEDVPLGRAAGDDVADGVDTV